MLTQVMDSGTGGCPSERGGASERSSSSFAEWLSRCPGIYRADRSGRFLSLQSLLQAWTLLGLPFLF